MEPTKPRWLWSLWIVGVMSSVLWFGSNISNACWEEERIALLNLKPFFNTYGYLNDWVEDKASNCCEWQRVKCNSTTGRVFYLHLEFSRARQVFEETEYFLPKDAWYLNVSLFLPFAELKELSLRGDGILGFVEHKGFAKLSSTLKALDLGFNYLGGSDLLPLTNLSSLIYLDLSYQSTIPSRAIGSNQLPMLSKLETLYLDGNSLNNSVLAQIGSLSSLKQLYLDQNNFEGMLPIQALNNLTNLKTLDLSRNRIESLHSEYQGNETQLRLTNLEKLDLSYNLLRNLHGLVDNKGLSNLINLRKLILLGNKIESLRPQDGGRQLKLNNLEELDLAGNMLNSSVFESLKGLWNLKSLILMSNQLKGSIDTQDLGVFTNLERLDISYNELNGFLSGKGWCNLPKLEELDISRNSIERNLPSCLSNLTSLQMLDISNNQFTGDLAPLTNLTSLRFLALSKNHFQVPLSSILFSNLTALKLLWCDGNKLAMESVVYNSAPKLQLKYISLSGCTTNQPIFDEALSKFLYYQYDLRYIDLSKNNFSKLVPFWLIANNTELETLILIGNSFTGPLSLPPFPNLKLSLLHIAENNLEGPIPTNICSTFPSLEWLGLSQNALEGDIPPCFGGMSRLVILELSGNQLSGGVPKELTMNSSLKMLKLSKNKLSGKMVPTIFKSSTLSQLYLDGNNFVGELPEISGDDFGELLTDIDLRNNSLWGKIPNWIWSLSLWRLDLSNNHFDGTIPTELCNLNSLQFLDLSQNNLSGSIPSCFNPPLIKHVHLSENRLSGPLTYAFYNSSSLRTLDLNGNNLTGNIPEWIGTLSALSVLLLKANHLDGGIPIQLCRLQSLSMIDLSQNMLSGHIPSCLGNLTLGPEDDKANVVDSAYILLNMQAVAKDIGIELNDYERYKISPTYFQTYVQQSVEFSTKSASYSYKGYILQHMSGIDLSCNGLIGEIPSELGNLSEIHSLNLSHNNLTGVIPSSFSNLKQIESMDLSYNNLAGEIPKQLVELNSLEVFSVAHNNLSGSTPERKAQFGTFGESSYEGNPLLCGPPLNNSCSTDPPSTVSTASNEEGESSLLDMYVFCVSFFVVYVAVLLVIVVVLYINPYWRRLWFLFIEDCIDTCRYSKVGRFIVFHIFKKCA